MAVDVSTAAGQPEPVRKLPRKARRLIWWSLGILVFAAVALSTWFGEGSGKSAATAPKAFCKATAKYEDEIQRQSENGKRNLARQLPLVEQIAATAPQKVRADAETFYDAMVRVRTDASVKDDPKVKAAVDRVNRYYSQGCGVFARNGM